MNITKKIKDQAKKLFSQNDFKELFVNKKGEFFTNENLAKLSVKDPKKELAVLKREDYTEAKKPTGEGTGTGEGGNGTGTETGTQK